MSPIPEPTAITCFVTTALIYLFPLGALVLRPLWHRAGRGARVLLGTITLLGVLSAPLSVLLTIGMLIH